MQKYIFFAYLSSMLSYFVARVCVCLFDVQREEFGAQKCKFELKKYKPEPWKYALEPKKYDFELRKYALEPKKHKKISQRRKFDIV